MYKLMKRIILRGGYDRAATEAKLTAFLEAGSLTQAEYDELSALMEETTDE